MANDNFIIGFDIGTSSLKLVILNANTNKIDFELKKSTQEARIASENSLFNEQKVDVIVENTLFLFNQIPSKYYERLTGIQFCGQMHGIVLWNTLTKKYSRLITWQDARCTPDFIENLPVKSISNVSSGYGCATLFWLQENHKLYPEMNIELYNYCGTIQDYLSFLFSGKCGVISDQNALSWGYCNLSSLQWQENLKETKKFPFEILPKIEKPGFKISDSVNISLRKLNSTSIYAALGDLQCSFYSCVQNYSDCVINISTSSQLCIAISALEYENIKVKLPSSVTINPYIDDQVLLVAASMNGGNVLDNFIDTLIEWNEQLGLKDIRNETVEQQKDKIWKKLISIAESNPNGKCELEFIPRLYGERHDTKTFGSLNNISVGNFKLGKVFNSLCNGLIQNLHDMFPMDILIKELGCKRIIATGSGIIKNPIVKKQLELVFNKLPIDYKDSSDSAVGAALFLKDLIF